MKDYFKPFHELVKNYPSDHGFYKSRFTKSYKTKMIILITIMGAVFSIFFYIFFKIPLMVLFIFIIMYLGIIIFVIFYKTELKGELPKLVELNDELKEKTEQELLNLEILSEGKAIKIIDKIAYSDAAYAKNPFRTWAWRETGTIVLTTKELIFLGQKSFFLIPLMEINFIQPFITLGVMRTARKICEVNYGIQNMQAIFMGTLGKFYCPDPMNELEFKSMKLMEYLLEWFNTFKSKKEW